MNSKQTARHWIDCRRQHEPGVGTTHWALDDASNVAVKRLEPETNRQAFLSADSGLTDGGHHRDLEWISPREVISILQCSGDGSGGAVACNISGGKILQPDPEGMGSLDLVIRTGPVRNVCDSANPCFVRVNDANMPTKGEYRIPRTSLTEWNILEKVDQSLV